MAQRCVVLALCALPVLAQAQLDDSLADPAAPGVSAKPMRYESVFDRGPNSAKNGAQMLPWTRLFEADGSFVSEEDLNGMPSVDRVSDANATAPQSSERVAQTSSKDARGVVKALYPGRGKIKLKHGPISRLEMPGMTMVFAMRNPSDLARLNVGDEVDFSVELDGSAFVVNDVTLADTTMAAAPPSAPDTSKSPLSSDATSDSRGVVKAIYRDRNKVKIKHGPIGKLEMPAMTMVFRVEDPSLFELIEQGDETGFTIEMKGSAFVVTGFQP